MLTSPRAPRVAAARRLARRAMRQAERRFLVEGPQAVAEALAEPGAVVEVFATAEAGERVAALVAAAGSAGLPVQLVSGEVMSSLAQTVTPQGIVAVARFRDVPLAEIVALPPRLVAVLAAVRDPGNAGTVLRAADAAGADAIVLTDASVDPYNGKCVRASAGSLFHLPFAVGVPARLAVAELRAAGLAVLAATGAGGIDIDALEAAGELAGPTAWIFGNEAWGLPDDLLGLADKAVRVPIHGRAESLNLATAATVCLYASARAQRRPGGCRGDESPEKT
ncbi:MAG: TrmH family RNA methyltransferase [Frankiaceae bacterium]